MRMDWPDPGCAFAVVIILCRLPERLRSRQNMGMHEVGQTATGVEKDVVLNTRTFRLLACRINVCITRTEGHSFQPTAGLFGELSRLSLFLSGPTIAEFNAFLRWGLTEPPK